MELFIDDGCRIQPGLRFLDTFFFYFISDDEWADLKLGEPRDLIEERRVAVAEAHGLDPCDITHVYGRVLTPLLNHQVRDPVPEGHNAYSVSGYFFAIADGATIASGLIPLAILEEEAPPDIYERLCVLSGEFPGPVTEAEMRRGTLPELIEMMRERPYAHGCDETVFPHQLVLACNIRLEQSQGSSLGAERRHWSVTADYYTVRPEKDTGGAHVRAVPPPQPVGEANDVPRYPASGYAAQHLRLA